MPDLSLPPWVGAILFGFVFVIGLGVIFYSRLTRDTPPMFEDPDKAQPRNQYDIDSWSERK